MKNKIIFCTISLADKGGGLEKNIIKISNLFDDHNYIVEIITFDKIKSNSFYKINENIIWHKIGINKPHKKITFKERILLLLKIRSIIKSQNNKIICFHHGISFRFLLANLFLKNKIYVSERNSLSLYNYVSKSKYNINYFCLFFVHKIFVQFDRYINQYPKKIRKKISVIPNIVDQQENLNIFDIYNKREKIILSIGRLENQKNFDVLIKIFSKISIKYPEWKLLIIGNGSLKKTLENKIIQNKMSNNIFINDSTSKLDEFYKKASIFCLLSKWEGFCNVVSEALSFGIPCIGLKSSDGICDLIQHDFNGLLAENYKNESEIIDCFDKLMSNNDLRLKLGNNAINSVKKYNKVKVFNMWKQNI